MDGSTASPAATITQPEPGTYALGGCWTAFGMDRLEARIAALRYTPGPAGVVVDGSNIQALDSAGGRLVQRLLRHLREGGAQPQLRAWKPAFVQLIEIDEAPVQTAVAAAPRFAHLDQLGRNTMEGLEELYAGLSFFGEVVLCLWHAIERPARLRLRTVLFNIQTAGINALPIVGMLAFMLGVVVAYQGADQLRRYGANIFIVDLVGLSMVREFAPLVTAIIVAGRSGSAYAAQIGAMQTSEEIDALRTLGIVPLELLTLPKLLALMIALPLLTVFADALGIFGGMMMASAKLDVGYVDFFDRLGKAVSVSSYLIGIAKAPVFAAIIAVVGCFQGFRTSGGADSVGRQTTRSVVQAIFLVILADSLFSVLFSILDL